jgi:PKD repeat protein
MNLYCIKRALNLTDLTITDQQLESILDYPLNNGIPLRAFAEIATIRVLSINKLYYDFWNALAKLSTNSISFVYNIPFDSWESLLNELDNAALKTLSDSITVSLLRITKDHIRIGAGLVDIFDSALDVGEHINMLDIANKYWQWAGENYASDAEWEDFFHNQLELDKHWWFSTHESELRQAAIFNAESIYHRQEILDFRNGIAQLIRYRVNIYNSYKLGLSTASVTSSPTTLIVMNNGENAIYNVTLVNERPFWPDEKSESSVLLLADDKATLSFPSGVDKINYLDFSIFNIPVRVPFTASPALPIISKSVISPYGDYAPREISFNASHSIISEGYAASEYQWDFGDDTPTQNGVTVNHTYQQPGDYWATLTILTSGGDAVTRVKIYAYNPVSAAITINPEHGSLSTVFEFDASASASFAGEIISWKWDFGDNSPEAEGEYQSHQYAQGGIGVINLTVINVDNISDPITKVIYIGEQEPVYDSGDLVGGADAIWERGLCTPPIDTVNQRLYNNFTIGTDSVWNRELQNPAIDTLPQHLQDCFVVGADSQWHIEVINPQIDSVVTQIYDFFTVGADAVWQKKTLSPQNYMVPGDVNADKITNILDMTKVARIILTLDPETPGADPNMDGFVNVLDMTYIAKIILGIQ